MLKIIEIQNPSEKEILFSSTDIQERSWIVSDLFNKFELQKVILDRVGFYEDDYVLRISEFWQKVLKIYFPQVQLWSKDYLGVWLQDQVQKLNLELGPNLSSVILDLFDQLHGVFFQEESQQLLHSWFEANPESFQKWGSWYNVAKVLFKIQRQTNGLLPKWVPSYLLQELGPQMSQVFTHAASQEKEIFKKGFLFDVGPELTKVEAELIHWLSRGADVIVVQVSSNLKKDFPFPFEAYDFLSSVADEVQLFSEPNRTVTTNSSNQVQLADTKRKLSGVMAEIEDVSTTVSQWLQEGIYPYQIAVVSNQIESYWPYLNTYFTKCQIPVNKDKTTRAHSYTEIAQWISRLKILSNNISFSNIELSSLSLNLFEQIRYEDFFGLYSQSLLPEDLKRWDILNSIIESFRHSSKNIKSFLSKEEFIGIALSQLNVNSLQNLDAKILEKVFKELLNPIFNAQLWKLDEWIQIFEIIVSKVEIKVSTGQTSGVAVLNLSSAESFSFKRIYFLGLSESQFQKKGKGVISQKEALKLKNELGFIISDFENQNGEFWLTWLLEHFSESQKHESSLQMIFSYPMTGFGGELEAPLPFWLHLQPEGEILVRVPEPNLWMQERAQVSIQPWLEKMFQSVVVPLPSQSELKLSASSIERYISCPFQYFAERMLKLKDAAIVDLDPDRRNIGSISHSYLEQITMNFSKLVSSLLDRKELEKELEAILDDLKTEQQLLFVDTQVWSGIKKRLVATGVRFLEFEKQWSLQFPNSQIKETEKAFKWVKDNCVIQGKIDRIDMDNHGNTVVIDYKSGVSSFKTYSGWIEHRQLQLLIYCLALQNQNPLAMDETKVYSDAVDIIRNENTKNVNSEIDNFEIAGAFLYDFNRLNRDKGFKVQELGSQLFSFDDQKRNKIDISERDRLLQQTIEVIDETVVHIRNGKFDPKPRKLETCKDCEWRDLCRAPHLQQN